MGVGIFKDVSNETFGLLKILKPKSFLRILSETESTIGRTAVAPLTDFIESLTLCSEPDCTRVLGELFAAEDLVLFEVRGI